MNVASKIKSRRKELNLTQQEVAYKVFVTRQTISKWELGKSSPDPVSLKLLKNALEIDTFEDLDNDSSEDDIYMTKKMQLKDILFTLFLWLPLLPLRIFLTLLRKYQDSKMFTYVITPAFIALCISHIETLNPEVVNPVIVFSLTIYFAWHLYSDFFTN